MKQQVFHIVGPQGAGKSTLAHQLMKSYDNGVTTIDRFGEHTPNDRAWETSTAEIVIVEHGNLTSSTPRAGEKIITLSFAK
jgi:adenylate kinase family enzyme